MTVGTGRAYLDTERGLGQSFLQFEDGISNSLLLSHTVVYCEDYLAVFLAEMYVVLEILADAPGFIQSVGAERFSFIHLTRVDQSRH